MSPSITENNKRIAKNTIVLYFRTFITMMVGLYTGRVMLQALGVENYGINNVVGGIVGFFTIISGTMGLGVSRFMTYSLGKDDLKRQKIVFSTCVSAQIIIAIFISISIEVIGVWFLNTGANIPVDRMYAANWVLQCSIVTMFLSLVNAPYVGLIIAHERMGIYAYMSIVDVVFKLLIVFAIISYDGDRLILLSLLGVCVSVVMTIFYNRYCHRNFGEARYKVRTFDKVLYKEMLSFSGWGLMGSTTWMFNTQGLNILVNIFFGVAFNAARGIAMTVNGAIQSFVNSFSVSFTPQITKSYAAGDEQYAISLANRGTKFTWLMMFIFIVPVCCEADMILKLWLGTPPDYAALFLRFAMFESLAVQSGATLLNLIRANGEVKGYFIEESILAIGVFPLSWCLFHFGAPVWTPYLIFIIIYFSVNLVRFRWLKKLMSYSIRTFLKESFIPCAMVSVTSFVIPLAICYAMEDGILRFFIVVPVSILSTLACIYLFGLSQGERSFCMERIQRVLKKYHR